MKQVFKEFTIGKVEVSTSLQWQYFGLALVVSRKLVHLVVGPCELIVSWAEQVG